MILGLTGTNASGKSTVAKYFVKKGFAYYSLSDELRALLKKRKIPATRENLIEAGKHYRERYGNGYLAAVVAKKIGKKKAVVDSIRNLGEVAELRKIKGFILIAVDAPVKMRFERARKRMSRRDQKTFFEFTAKEKEELHGKGAGQQIAACMKKADFKINNNLSLGNLYKKMEATLRKIGKKANHA
ncbi:AAA family ATPase [Candidatus Woesearchaeota archaeon]|nr:AAA family ATPase [Candidatus Woesearchaeota archaeon]